MATSNPFQSFKEKMDSDEETETTLIDSKFTSEERMIKSIGNQNIKRKIRPEEKKKLLEQQRKLAEKKEEEEEIEEKAKKEKKQKKEKRE